MNSEVFYGGKMFSRDRICEMKNLIRDDIYVCEDFEFVARYLENCNKIIFQNSGLYYYFRNENSLTGKKLEVDRASTLIKAYDSVEEIYKKNAKEFLEILYYEELRARLNLNYRYYFMKRRNEFDYRDKEKFRKVMKSKKINIKKKMYMFFSYKFPIITSKIKYMVNRRRK